MSDEKQSMTNEYLPPDDETSLPPAQPPKPELWTEMKEKPVPADAELIRHRFLCRGGYLLLVGQTGIGKSSFCRQMALHFALGKPFLGLEPIRPLRSLIIQAENDDQDEAEMCEGVVAGSGITQEQLASATPLILHYREQSRSGQAFISDTVRPLMEQVKPDLVWIDPALAYLGGDQNNQQAVGGWVRNQLLPLFTEYNCAVVIVHHTPKLNVRKLSEGWVKGDYSYIGTGSAEWVNAARAMLCLLSTGVTGVYELHATKRGTRLRWKEGDGLTMTTCKVLQHSREPGQICWKEASDTEVASMRDQAKNGKPIPSIQEFATIFPANDAFPSPRDGLLAAGEIRNRFTTMGWKRDSYAGVCEEALKKGAISLVREGHGNRTKLYGRPGVVTAYLASRGPNKGELDGAKN